MSHFPAVPNSNSNFTSLFCIFRLSVLGTIQPRPFIDPAISPGVNPVAMLLIIIILSFILSAVLIFRDPVAMPIIIPPLSDIRTAIWPREGALATHLIFRPIAVVAFAFGPCVYPFPVLLTFYILTLIFGAIRQTPFTISILEIILPASFVFFTIFT